jgi:hypothetical protein
MSLSGGGDWDVRTVFDRNMVSGEGKSGKSGKSGRAKDLPMSKSGCILLKDVSTSIQSS